MNNIPEDDYRRRIIALMDGLDPHSIQPRSIVEEMFKLYNDRMLPRENGLSCGGCRNRVYKRMKEHYENNYLNNG